MPSVQSKEASDKESEKKLQCLYRHIALNLVVLTAPFTQRADLFLTFPEFGTFFSRLEIRKKTQSHNDLTQVEAYPKSLQQWQHFPHLQHSLSSASIPCAESSRMRTGEKCFSYWVLSSIWF